MQRLSPPQAGLATINGDSSYTKMAEPSVVACAAAAEAGSRYVRLGTPEGVPRYEPFANTDTNSLPTLPTCIQRCGNQPTTLE
jgi:hypothetical protein